MICRHPSTVLKIKSLRQKILRRKPQKKRQGSRTSRIDVLAATPGEERGKLPEVAEEVPLGGAAEH